MSPSTLRELEERLQVVEQNQVMERIYRESLKESLDQISRRLDPLTTVLLEIKAINTNIEKMQTQLNANQCKLDVLERADYDKFIKDRENIKENIVKVIITATTVSLIGFLVWAARLYILSL